MSPALVAGFLWVATAVLWWSGWREETAGDIPDRAVAVFLAGWPIAAWWTPLAGRTVTVGGAFLWTLAASACMMLRIPPADRWRALSAGLMAASLGLLLSAATSYGFEADALRPVGAAAVGVVSAALLRSAGGQVAALSAGLLAIELLNAAWPDGERYAFGALLGAESWWIAIASARIASLGAEWLRGRKNRPVRTRHEGDEPT